MPDLARTITDDHATRLLFPRALNPKEVSALGVYSVTTPEELPEEFARSKYATVPGLMFPWNSPTGGVVLQYRPDEPVTNDAGHPVKYVFPNGTLMVLNRIRDPKPHDGPMLLAEGTMQSLAAAAYTHPAWAVYGMSGCWSWRHGETQVAIPDLMVAEGRDVVIALDADAATNRAVYDAGMALKDALIAEGAATVKFLRLAGHGSKAGLDDVLGTRPEEKRAPYLARLLGHAADKPADTRPSMKKNGVKGALTVGGTATAPGGRPYLVVNGDRHEVINEMEKVLRSKWDGTGLFCYGGVLARRDGAGMEPVTEGVLADLISEAAACVATSSKGDAAFAWPDSLTSKAVLSSRAANFAPLERVSEAPFVRADGTICQTSGYDEASRTYLLLDEAAEAIEIPEEPTEDDVRSAVKLLTGEWLGDLFDAMPEDADQANALGLVLTPLIRGLVPLAPLAVVDGLQMGVGKNLLADVVAIFATGRAANPLPYSRDDEENRKVITSSFRAGHELFVFDEAHVIEGRNLARALTGLSWSDRVLGVSNMAEYPNRITWVALGNNVAVNGDMARRVYRIRLSPATANPQDRSADSFRHPDLKRWTHEHRAELLAAALTIVRAWFADPDRQESAAGRRFGSFEPWGGMVGGILDRAGVPGFLANLVEWRSETDYETAYWADHFAWLRRTFGDAEFSTADVKARMIRAPQAVEHPPRLTDHSVSDYGRQLGQAYGRVRNRVFGGVQLTRTMQSGGHGNRWRVSSPEGPVPGDGGSGGSDGSPPATRMEKISPEAGTRETRKEAEEVIPPIPPIPPITLPADPLADLLPLAAVVPAPMCPDCEAVEEPVPPGLFWYACRSCHPATFGRG